jgi:ABC-type transport system substrate-binding protein
VRFRDVLRGRAEGNFQLFSLQWVGGALVDPDILRRVFHSDRRLRRVNRGYYSNPEVDRLIDLASTRPTRQRNGRNATEAQKRIAEDAPYISIWNRTNVAIAQRQVRRLRSRV